MRKNPTKPPTTIVVDYDTYYLLFDFEAIADAEDLTGRPLLTGLSKKDITTPTVSLVRSMLFACVHANHPKLTYEQVKALVTRDNLAEVWGKVLEAWTAGLAEPEPEAIAEENPTEGQS